MIEITRPLMTLVDEAGHPIPGVSKSTSAVEAMEKASQLGPGTYGLIRPEATIVVTADVEQVLADIPLYLIDKTEDVELG